MKTLLNNLLFLLILSSCGMEKVDYLYDKDDPEYPIIQALGVSECIEKSKILQELDKTSNFRGYKEGTLYKIEETENKSIKYAKIVNIENNTMIIAITSTSISNSSLKTIVYTQEDNKTLLDAVSKGVCLVPKSYKHSDLNSTSFLNFTSERMNVATKQGDKIKDYTKVVETYKLDKKIPLILHVFNGEKTYTKVRDGKETKEVMKYKISEISQSECSKDSDCNFDSEDTKSCYPQIDKEHYSKVKIGDNLVNLEANCK